MTDRSAHLDLPFLMPAQAQKHVTMNEALLRLDALTQLSVVSATTTAQPTTPTDGALWILPAGKTGAAWGAMANGALAYWRDGVWEEITPREGWRAWVCDTDGHVVWSGAAWIDLAVANDSVTDAKLRNSAALSVIGRSANSVGDPADIAAGTDGHVLRRAGTTLGFGQIALGAIADDLVTYAKIQNVSAADKVLGRATAGAGDIEEIAFTTQARQLCDDTSFSAMRTTLGLGTMATEAATSFAPLTGATFSGNVTVNAGVYVNGGVQMSGTFPIFGFYDSDNAANNLLYLVYANASAFEIPLVDDAVSTANAVVSIPRSANTATAFKVAAPVLPMADNTHTLGSASFRWSTVYAATGTINTSDAREKSPVRALPDAVKRAVLRIIADVGVFQWRDAIAQKGEDGARLHIGVTAQAVRDAFEAEGENPERWALFCADPRVEVIEERVDTGDARALIAARTERPALDEKGAPDMVLGVRHDQLLLLALAAMAG